MARDERSASERSPDHGDAMRSNRMDAKQTTNPADRAVASIRAAIGRLALLLGDEDPATVDAAATALGAIGPFAVGPLAAALPKGASPRHRAAIIAALLSFDKQEKA